jgi:rhodanese-related sulfurtransferase
LIDLPNLPVLEYNAVKAFIEEKIMSTFILTIAIILGLIGLFMAWLATRQNKELMGRLERVDDRLQALQNEIKMEQEKTEEAKLALQGELQKLKGENPTPVKTNAGSVSSSPPTLTEITPQALKTRLDQGEDLIVVDMRQKFEYKAGHIPGAINMFVNDIPLRAEELPKDKDIVFQCWSGNTSLQAAAYLIDNGWPAERIASLSGGISGWTQTHGMDNLVQS